VTIKLGTLLLDAAAGLVAGLLVLLAVTIFQRLRPGK